MKLREEKRLKEGMTVNLEENKFNFVKKENELEEKRLNLSSIEKELFQKTEIRRRIQEEKEEISKKIEERNKKISMSRQGQISHRRNRTYEEIYGPERAKEIRKKQSLVQKKVMKRRWRRQSLRNGRVLSSHFLLK